MKVSVVGCSGSFAQPGTAASCYLLQASTDDGQQWSVALDFGSGALGPLQEVLPGLDLDAVVLSHLHPDHFLDLTGLYVAYRYHPTVARSERLPLYGPPGTLARLEAAYGPDQGQLDQVYDSRELHDREPVTIGPFTITPYQVQHPVLAFGLRVECAGAVLAYTGDTDTCPALVELAQGADVLLAEASFQEGRDLVRGIHLTGLRAGQVATQAGVRHLVLTHIPVWTDPATVAAEAATAYTGPISLARPAQQLNLH